MDDELETRLKAEAFRQGFTLSGIAPATEADGFARYQHWLDKGYVGKMDYLHRSGPRRKHPSSILDTVRSVLMLGMEYGGDALTPQPPLPRGEGEDICSP